MQHIKWACVWTRFQFNHVILFFLSCRSLRKCEEYTSGCNTCM